LHYTIVGLSNPKRKTFENQSIHPLNLSESCIKGLLTRHLLLTGYILLSIMLDGVPIKTVWIPMLPNALNGELLRWVVFCLWW
jgi:hypothetical protein